ncbi:MAG TPA: energy transducer TonB [Pyrinomonadaceae bacterium]
MPRTLKLLLSISLLAGSLLSARAQSGVRPAPAAPQQQVEVKLQTSADADALKAEQLCEQGRAHAARGGASEARATFASAVRLYLRIYMKERPGGSDAAAYSAFRAQTRERLKGAPRCVEDYLALVRATPFEREQLEAFAGQVSMLVEADAARSLLSRPEVDARAVITSKPHPGFTEEARRNNVRGRVRLRAVLGLDGVVRHVFVLEGLPFGMSEECVAAAKRIRFTPAVKNGRPVSQIVVLEYNFDTH